MADDKGTPGTPGTPQQRIPVSIQEEMRTSYLDYAMSVIIGRAIPDVRDGLKPVHRRILYSAYEQGLVPTGGLPQERDASSATCSASTTRTATRAVYDAMVRLAQDFSMRYPLIDGQGNYGSIDGDPAAAYRYTEARLTQARDRAPRRTSTRSASTSSRTSTTACRSRWSSRRASRTSSSTAPAASPSAWRRTSRRTTSARSSTRPST